MKPITAEQARQLVISEELQNKEKVNNMRELVFELIDLRAKCGKYELIVDTDTNIDLQLFTNDADYFISLGYKIIPGSIKTLRDAIDTDGMYTPSTLLYIYPVLSWENK